MKLLKRNYFYVLSLFYLNLLTQDSNAEMTIPAVTPIDSLYSDILQREYADPVVFPNHQVERKAQRSPSLRLRFGRSDPDVLNTIVEKRWFGDVNQKPIRSPSLRLRFGRRSDPSIIVRTSYDDLVKDNLQDELLNLNKLGNLLHTLRQYDSAYQADNTDVTNEDDADFQREARKPGPLRLRWGRSTGSVFNKKVLQTKPSLEKIQN